MTARDDSRSDKTTPMAMEIKLSENPGFRMTKTSMRVGIVYVKNLADALRLEEPTARRSEFRWLRVEQFVRQGRRVRLISGVSAELVEHATSNSLDPLGLVIINERGRRTEILIEQPATQEHREVAAALLRGHAEFWCLESEAKVKGREQ